MPKYIVTDKSSQIAVIVAAESKSAAAKLAASKLGLPGKTMTVASGAWLNECGQIQAPNDFVVSNRLSRRSLITVTVCEASIEKKGL
jgi:hypothetical protein